MNLIYLKVGKGKDKPNGRIIISSGNSVANFFFSKCTSIESSTLYNFS
jgi:hypothetical protein